MNIWQLKYFCNVYSRLEWKMIKQRPKENYEVDKMSQIQQVW